MNEEFKQLVKEVNTLRNLTPDAPDQEDYVIEECSELIKEIIKQKRNKACKDSVFEEACDVMASVFILLYDITDDIDYKVACEYIKQKYKRAIDRYKKGEL